MNLFKNKYLWIIAIITLVHLSILGNAFTWLEHNDIEEGRAIAKLGNVSPIFYKPFGETTFYRPVVILINSLDNIFWGKNPLGYHLTNLILHLVVAISFTYFCKVFWKLKDNLALLGMLILGVHPYSVFIVSSIVERQESLMVLFIIWTIYFYANSRLAKFKYAGFVSVLFFALALFTKETAIVITPALIVFWEVVNKNKFFKKDIFLWLAYTVVLIFYLALRLKAVPGIWNISTNFQSVNQWLGTRILLMGRFLLGLFNPIFSGINDSYRLVGLNNIFVFAAIAIILGMVILVVKRGIKDDISKSLIILTILLMPALDIIPVPRVASPHYGYLPLISFAIIPLVVINKLNGKLQKLGYATVFIWILICGINTFKSGFVFKNDLTLFSTELKKDSHYPEGNFYMGNYYLNKGDLDAAKKYYENVLNQPDKNYKGYLDLRAFKVNMGIIKAKEGNSGAALALFEDAKEGATGKTLDQIIYDEAVVYFGQKNYKAVVELLSDKANTMENPNVRLLLMDAQERI